MLRDLCLVSRRSRYFRTAARLIKTARYLSILTVLCHAPASAADLSPGHWPAVEREELEQGQFFFYPPFAGTIQGKSILVTGTASPAAVHAGIEALRQGGTAADAAATVALTQIATNLGATVSYAGVSELAYFDAKTRQVYALDAGWASYEGETDPASIPPADDSVVTGNSVAGAGVGALGRQTLVPGFMSGIEAMHTRFGRLPFADLFQPAIWYAEHGVTVPSGLGAYFKIRQPRFWGTPEGHRFASMPDGSLPKAGDLFPQPDLARTLKAVAAHGAGYMYTGDWAHAYVAAVQAAGGKISPEDLARYRPEWRKPLSVQFAGATVFGPGEDPSGTCPTLEALNLLSGLQIETMGPYWRDPKTFAAYARVLRYVYYGDNAPEIAAFTHAHGFTSCKARLTPQYAAAVNPNIGALLGVPGATATADRHTQAVVVVDRWGNVAALVHTINTVNWGDTGIVVGGVPVSDAGGYYRNEPAVMKPGARLPNGLSPVIALRGGKPVLAVATVGLSLVPETTRLVSGVLANGLDLQTLMSAPQLLLNLSPAAPEQAVGAQPEAVPAGRYDSNMLQALAAAGISVREETPQVAGATRGTAVVAIIDQPSGRPRAVEVSALPGYAESDLQRRAATPATIETSPEILDQYVGDYQVAPNIEAHITREGDQLYAQATQQPRVKLFPDAEDHFFEKVTNIQLGFHRGQLGKATEMIVYRGSVKLTAPRIGHSGAAATPAS